MYMAALEFNSEGSLLYGSVQQNLTIQSTGQEVIDYDFSQDNSFNNNTEWE